MMQLGCTNGFEEDGAGIVGHESLGLVHRKGRNLVVTAFIEQNL